jgi:hypothetical protein
LCPFVVALYKEAQRQRHAERATDLPHHFLVELTEPLRATLRASQSPESRADRA